MSGSQDKRARLAASVIEGSDGYLFHRDHEAIEQISGASAFTPSELAVWRETIEERQSWCRENGIAYRMMIIPEKHVVYEDKLTSDIAVSPDRPAMQLLRALHESATMNILYPAEILKSARAELPTYFMTDTHWTTFGGFLAYQALIESVRRELPLEPRIERENLAFTTKPFIGDLGVRLEPERSEQAVFATLSLRVPFQRVFENKAFTRGRLQVYETLSRTSPRCVLFRDSFANYMIPHMIPLFSRLTVLGSQHMHYDLVKSERPDIIVHAIAERFLGNLNAAGRRQLPQDHEAPSLEAFSHIAPEALAATRLGMQHVS